MLVTRMAEPGEDGHGSAHVKGVEGVWAALTAAKATIASGVRCQLMVQRQPYYVNLAVVGFGGC